jgi:hypothetical protein
MPEIRATTRKGGCRALVEPNGKYASGRFVDQFSSYDFQQHIKKPLLNQTNARMSLSNTQITLQRSTMSGLHRLVALPRDFV